MSLTLTEAISQCPRSLFGDKDKGIPPKYKKIFATVVKAMLTDAGEKFSEKTIDLVAETVNVSSMQRGVAIRREFLEGGGVKPPKKERGKPRPKATKPDEDDLGLGKAKKATKAAKPLKKSGKPAPVAKKATPKAPTKAASKPASALKPAKTTGTKVDAIAAARAALAAKKTAKETVEI